jgi:putative Ca2+/H+ antiporter (TMEM165/GDT1 family)
MDFAVIATVFVVILIAELPDKSMIATLVMGSRSNPFFVWIGASSAFLVHTVLAVVAGKLLLLLPHTVLEIIITVLFVGGAFYLLFVPEKEEEAKGEDEAEDEDSAAVGFRIAATAFGVIFIGELGDITQLLTINLVAKYHAPLEVGIGAGLAFITDAALGAFAGRALLRVLPLAKIRIAGGLVFLGFAGVTLYNLVAG